MRHYISLALLVCMLLSVCKKKKELPTEATILTDIAYGNDSRQKMDIYLPAERNAHTKVIVLLHGGGFVAGDKSEFTKQSKAFAARGYAVVNVNYRLVDLDGVLDNPIKHKPSTIKITDQLADINTAVKFALTKAIEWNVSTSLWTIAGHSAGGTLALLYGYGDYNFNKQFKAVANWAGATNFAFTDESEARLLDPRIAEVIYRAVGAEIKNENRLYFMAVSPLWVALNGKTQTTINIRPQDNSLSGLPDGSKTEYETFTNALNNKGAVNKHIEIAGADHGFSKPGNWETVYNETDAFFISNVK